MCHAPEQVDAGVVNGKATVQSRKKVEIMGSSGRFSIR